MSRDAVAGADVRVRPPVEADLPAIAALLTQLGYPSTEQQVRQRLSTLRATGVNHVRLAEVGGDVVGLAAIQIGEQLEKDGRHGQLTALVTDERLRRRGVARALLHAAEGLARDAGCELFFLRTNKRRSDAQAFYRAEGFEETHLTFNKKL